MKKALSYIVLTCLLTACYVNAPDRDLVHFNADWVSGQWELTRKVIDYQVLLAGVTVASDHVDDSFSIGHRDVFDLKTDHTFLINADTAGTWNCNEHYVELHLTNPDIEYYQMLADIGLDTDLQCAATSQDSTHVTLYYFGQKNIVIGNLSGELYFYLEKPQE